jgi:hypothetical protein
MHRTRRCRLCFKAYVTGTGSVICDVGQARMRRRFSFDAVVWSLSPLALLGVYFAAYLLTTDIYRGHLGDMRYRIRLFRSTLHQRIFSPVLLVEQRLRPADPQFSGQVHSGCSLPPAEEEDR